MDMSSPQENLFGRALREAPKAYARRIANQAMFNGFDSEPVSQKLIGKVEMILDIFIETHLNGQEVVDDLRSSLDKAETLGDIRAVMAEIEQALPPEDRNT
ncbi:MULTISPECIES: hypothetical protein [unclassified Luteibacter]|uniref:hypothetical protein n=1 Tax=Luteibacter sp. PvP019 TaxID=3156436 RepID=UPI00339B9301